MNGPPYYKRYPRDFIEGTIGMSFELKTAYSFVLDLMYIQNGYLPDDSRYISGLLSCSVRKWNLLRKQLLETGKVKIIDEFLTNDRVLSEVESLGKYSEQQAKKGRITKKNNDLRKATAEQRLSHSNTNTYKEKESKEKESVEVVSWDQVSPHDIHLQRPDDPLTEYTEGELAMLNVEFDLLDIEGELTSLVDWAWNKGIVNDNERKRKIHSILKKKQMELEAGRALLDRPPAAPVSKEALENLNSKRAR